jgi:hypothetical protein
MTSRRRYACTLTATHSTHLDERSGALSAFAFIDCLHCFDLPTDAHGIIVSQILCLKKKCFETSHKHNRKREREVASSVLP